VIVASSGRGMARLKRRRKCRCVVGKCGHKLCLYLSSYLFEQWSPENVGESGTKDCMLSFCSLSSSVFFRELFACVRSRVPQGAGHLLRRRALEVDGNSGSGHTMGQGSSCGRVQATVTGDGDPPVRDLLRPCSVQGCPTPEGN
jgi:hypothetical protein